MGIWAKTFATWRSMLDRFVTRLSSMQFYYLIMESPACITLPRWHLGRLPYTVESRLINVLRNHFDNIASEDGKWVGFGTPHDELSCHKSTLKAHLLWSRNKTSWHSSSLFCPSHLLKPSPLEEVNQMEATKYFSENTVDLKTFQYFQGCCSRRKIRFQI